jgi:rSAM/selenodomain-associated transferase 1
VSVRILIFAKAPQPGTVKTRLIPALGPDGAARLATCMLEHMLAAARASAMGPVELCTAPAITSPSWSNFSMPGDITFSEQGEGDLGARMGRNAERILQTGEAVMLVGTDCPALDAPTLRAAGEALARHDSVMHPTADGGYALLGIKRFHPSLFTNIAWSTSTVASTTLQRLLELKWSVARHEELHDIDEPADLQYLPPGWHERLAL